MEKLEKMIEREIAWRIFANEFNMSNHYINEGDERAPNYIITPTGAKCNRLFIIGVITEVESIGRDNKLYRARIADPSGVFTIYAGQYQPEPAIFLSELQVPAYVALVGKARKYEPEDGSIYLSIRPEEINASDERQRDRWVLETAERTLERINIIEEALKSGLSGNELHDFVRKKVSNPALAHGIMLSIKHYENLDKSLFELRRTILQAVKTVVSDAGIIKAPQKPEQILEEMDRIVEDINEIVGEIKISEKLDSCEETPRLEPKEILAAIINELDTGKGISFSEVIETATKAGIDAETVEFSIKDLMDEGRCYEPKIGVLRKV